MSTSQVSGCFFWCGPEAGPSFLDGKIYKETYRFFYKNYIVVKMAILIGIYRDL